VCYPNFYEDYDSFIDRCKRELPIKTLNKNYRQRRSMYLKQGLGDIPFLLNTEARMRKYIEEYTLELEANLDQTYSDIALFIALNGVDAAWQLVNTPNELKDTLRYGYIEIGSYIDDRYSNKYGGESNPFIETLMVSIFLNRFLGKDLFIETTNNTIKTIINNSISTEEILDQIRKHNNKRRAKVIASTELGIAQASAELEAMKRIAMLKPIKKYWVGVLDDRIRDSHFEATNFYVKSNAIELDAYFNVNGSQMLHPRDYTAPPSEIVNCRCYLGYSFEK